MPESKRLNIPWRNGRHPHSDPELLDTQARHIEQFGLRYRSEPAILAWDLTDEPPEVKALGVVVGGSLSKGLEVKLDRDTSTEAIAVGRYVVVQGQSRRFFSMITDVMLDATDPRWAKIAPDMRDPVTGMTVGELLRRAKGNGPRAEGT